MHFKAQYVCKYVCYVHLIKKNIFFLYKRNIDKKLLLIKKKKLF